MRIQPGTYYRFDGIRIAEYFSEFFVIAENPGLSLKMSVVVGIPDISYINPADDTGNRRNLGAIAVAEFMALILTGGIIRVFGRRVIE